LRKRARVAKDPGVTGASVFMVIVSIKVEVTEFGDEAFVHCYDDMAVEHTRQMYCEDVESQVQRSIGLGVWHGRKSWYCCS
jgi:hypothetical protein